jgi:putative two-component system response regulator
MSANRRKIMLVDDDQSCRRQGRAILKDSYEVYPFPSAHKLFEVLEEFLPDLILLDIQMPVIDGFETIKRLKSNDRYASIPVIFLTASNDKESVIKGSSLGVAGFVRSLFPLPICLAASKAVWARSQKTMKLRMRSLSFLLSTTLPIY